MKYCVVKNTIKIIDGSENPIEIMLKNADNSGFKEAEVEILTEEEYQIRKELESIIEKQPSEFDILKEKNATLEKALLEIAEVQSKEYENRTILENAVLDLANTIAGGK